jgi:membrane-bound lytic murein transglycosylase D
MRVSEPASPLSFSQLLAASPALLRAESESNGLESLFRPPGARFPTKAQKLEDCCVAFLYPAHPEALSFLPFFLHEETIQSQCQVSEPQLILPAKGTSTEDKPLHSADDRLATGVSKSSQAFNLTPSTNTQPESPAEKGAKIPLNGNHDAAKIASSPLNVCEASSPLTEGFAPLEEASLDIFAWGYIGLQGPWQNQKPSAIISANFPSLSHQKVEETIGFFQTRADSFFSRALGRSQAYEDMMKKILREKNLPEELFYLALIESGYNPHAFSRAKASGIWQFVTKTARRFGLKVDKWVDERRDPEKSTYAAAEYLKSLYGMFNNWDLAAASYNAGEGKILKAMKRAKSQDFWEISRYRYIRKETKEYVPMFLAAVIIASEPQKYGFSNIDYHPPLLYEKVMVPPGTRLDLIAKAAETDLSEIKALNPALKKENVPPNCSQFEIKLPPGKKEIFEKKFPLLSQKVASKGGKHSVRRGETLSSIAKKHRVHLQDLCQVNGLSPQARIKPGRILSVPR